MLSRRCATGRRSAASPPSASTRWAPAAAVATRPTPSTTGGQNSEFPKIILGMLLQKSERKGRRTLFSGSQKLLATDPDPYHVVIIDPCSDSDLKGTQE
jgi:hypothetical protein